MAGPKQKRDAGGTWEGLEELRPGLRRVLSRHARDESEIEDVIQETLMRAARYRSRLSEDENLRSWSIRIAMNVLSNARRRSSRLLCSGPGDGVLESIEAREPGPAEAVEEADFPVGSALVEKDAALRHLAGAVATLRAEDRRLLASFYRGPGTSRWTAHECDVPVHLVKVRLFRARRRLLRALRRRVALLGPRTPLRDDAGDGP